MHIYFEVCGNWYVRILLGGGVVSFSSVFSNEKQSERVALYNIYVRCNYARFLVAFGSATFISSHNSVGKYVLFFLLIISLMMVI